MLSPRSLSRFLPALSLLLASVAHAGPVERMADVALHPSNADILVVRYLQGGTGLLYTSDGGKSFRLLCASAISSNKPNGPTAITNDGRVLIGTFDGMWQDNGKGCSWSSVASLQGKWMTDFIIDPTDPARILGVSGNGGEGVVNGIVRSDGDQWADLGSRDAVGITRLRAVKTGSGMRIYQSVLRVDPPVGDAGIGQPKYLIRVSNDQGQTWESHEFATDGGAFRLEAVDPTNPDRILASVSREGGGMDELLVSKDQGKTFSMYATLSDLGGLTLAPDGRIWIGEPTSISSPTASKGLWFAPNLDSMPTKISDYGVECLGYQPANQTLYGCQAYSFGKIDATSGMFNELFHFKSATEFVTCDGMDMAKVCETQLCLDYCAAGHFAQAKLCCAYNTMSCGPGIAAMEGTGGPEMCGGVAADGGTSNAGTGANAGASAGSGAAAAAGGGGSPPAAGTPAAGTTAGGKAPPPGGDGGCSCVAVGPQQRDSRPALLALLGLGLALIRRRRR
jgi:MYXO-CTERM domain-containing protein